jgi:hypothetical protein
MARTKKEALPAGRVEGLSIAAVSSPYADVTGTLLDLRGPWTSGLIDAWFDYEDATQPVGIAAWSGTANVAYDDRTHEIVVTWEGSWRPLSEDEWAALRNGDRPLAMTSFPPADELLPLPVAP